MDIASEKEENNTQQKQKKNKNRKEKQTDFPLGRYSQQISTSLYFYKRYVGIPSKNKSLKVRKLQVRWRARYRWTVPALRLGAATLTSAGSAAGEAPADARCCSPSRWTSLRGEEGTPLERGQRRSRAALAGGAAAVQSD